MITVHIPLTFRKRGERKLVVTPDGTEWAPRPRLDTPQSGRWRGRSGGGECWMKAKAARPDCICDPRAFGQAVKDAR